VQVRASCVVLVALRLGVIVFAPFQIEHFKRIFELLIIEFSFSVSNEICDDRRQKKCGLISTLVIALFRTSGFILIDRHDFSYLLHQHCRVTSLRIIQFPCISWIGIGENHALQSFTFGLHLLPTPVRSTRWANKRALKYVVHAYFYCAIYNERWTLISFGDICVPACHLCCDYTLTIPPSHTLPYYPGTQHPPCPLYQATIIGVGLPPSIMGAQRLHLRLVRGSADSGCLGAHCYLHHVPPRLHPASHPHNTLACNHCSLPPPSVLPPPRTHTFQHIIFCKCIGPKLCGRSFVKGARSMGLLRIHTTHSINTRKHPTSTRLGIAQKNLGCTPLLPPPKSVRLWGVHRHRTGWRLVGVPVRSTLQTV